MKVVGFKALKKNKKSKKFIIVSFSNVFKKLAIPMALLLLVFSINLIANSFFNNIAQSVAKFVETFASI